LGGGLRSLAAGDAAGDAAAPDLLEPEAYWAAVKETWAELAADGRVIGSRSPAAHRLSTSAARALAALHPNM
jgi:hypothetical protein